jgi:hypothetical protein
MTVEPKGFASIENDGRLSYNLEPSAETKTDFSFSLGKTATESNGARVVLTRSGESRPIIFKLPSREKISIKRIANIARLEELERAMKDVPSKMIITEEGRSLADVKIAISGVSLALFGNVSDQIMRQLPGIWDGSCMEIFGVAEQGDRINQLFLVPATDSAPAKAMHVIPAIVPAPEIKFNSWPHTGGYTSAALIPLAWWLKRDVAPERFLFEIVVNAGLDGNTFGRTAMFGNLDASIKSEGYAIAISVED